MNSISNGLSRILVAAVAIPVFLWALQYPKVSIFMFLVIGAIMLIEYITIVIPSKNNIAWFIPGTLGVLMSILPLLVIRINDETGAILKWFFIILWVTDTCAMIAGKIIGGRKLWKRVSFKKTWAGLLGGVLGASYASVYAAYYLFSVYDIYYSAIGALIAISSQLGDLVESSFKRYFKIKDSSNLLLGHGGFLDRFDGLLFTSSIVLMLNYYQIVP